MRLSWASTLRRPPGWRSPDRDSSGSGTVFPVSVKGVLSGDAGGVLLENERGEWELAGSNLEGRESPEECLAREIEEVLGIEAEIGPLLDAWVYEVLPGASVLELSYGCYTRDFRSISYSADHSGVGVFGLDGLGHIRLPYGRSVRVWSRRPSFRDALSS